MTKATTNLDIRWTAVLAALVLAVLAALAVAASPAAAYNGFVHGTITDCDQCHSAGPSDAKCTASGCHVGGFSSRQTPGTPTRTCWTCHDPGQDMASVQGAGCGSAAAGAACHNGGAHLGSNMKGCTTCHGTVVSFDDPNGSAHHNNTAYVAPTCVDCHGTHEQYVEGVTECGTCHAAMQPNHPALTSMAVPSVALTAKPASVKYGLTTIVSGSVKYGAEGLVGGTVTLQAKPFGATTYAGVAETTTGVGGAYAFVAQNPTLLTTYRVVTEGGVVGPTTVKPSVTTLDVKVYPALTIALSKTSFALGGKQTIKGKLDPAHPGGAVKLTIQRKVSGTWKTLVSGKSVALQSSTAYTTYSFGYKPLKKGSYRVKATIPATTGLAAFTTAYKTWVVK